jgi:hypothetical protein
MKCPYGNHETNKAVQQGDKFCTCNVCGKSSAVVTFGTLDGYKYQLVKVGRNTSNDPKLVRNIRLSNSEMKAIERGDLKLSVSGFRITLTI